MGRKIPLWQVIALLAFMVIALMFDIMKMDGYIHGVLCIIAAVACVVALLNGWKWQYIQQAMFKKIYDSLEAIMIFIVVGIMIAMWISSGVVQSLIYYGLDILSPKIFLVASCLLCCIISLATGSAWSTIGTIGVALVGIGTTLGVPLGWIGGSIISGSYFGDKMSPLSDTTNLAPAMAGSKLFEHIGHMIWTVTPSLIITLLIYLFMGFKIQAADTTSEDIMVLKETLAANFNITPLLFIAPVAVVIMAIKKVPALASIFIGAIIGLVMVPIFQNGFGGNFFASMCYEMYDGYVSATGNEFVDTLLTRGGIASMMYSCSLTLIALCYAGVLDGCGMLKSICDVIVKIAKTNGLLIMFTNFTCIFVNMCCADQYLGIVLPGAMFKEEFENRKLKAKNLSRCLEDAGTLSSPLIPWSTCGAFIGGAIGIQTLTYLPFAFLNFICPLVSIFYGFTGISIEKMTDEEYEEILRKREEAKKEQMASLEA